MSIAKPFKFLQRTAEGRVLRENRKYAEPFISPDCEIGPNVVVEAGYDEPTFIGSGVKLGPNVVIGHDVKILADAIICAGSIIGGRVIIGERAFIGMGAVVLPRRKIGADSLVGAGAVVTHDVADKEVVAGVPARRIRMKP